MIHCAVFKIEVCQNIDEANDIGSNQQVEELLKCWML
jgi:hypothetical protein